MKAVGYLGASNESQYNVMRNGEAFDMTAAGVTKIEVSDNGISIDSDSDSISFAGSLLTIKWGTLALKSGPYIPTIYAYRSDDLLGEVLFGPGKDPIYLTLVENERPV